LGAPEFSCQQLASCSITEGRQVKLEIKNGKTLAMISSLGCYFNALVPQVFLLFLK